MTINEILERKENIWKEEQFLDGFLKSKIDAFLIMLNESGEFAPGVTKDKTSHKTIHYYHDCEKRDDNIRLTFEAGCMGNYDFDYFIYPIDLVENPTTEKMAEWHKQQEIVRAEKEAQEKKNALSEVEEYEQRTYERLKKKFENQQHNTKRNDSSQYSGE